MLIILYIFWYILSNAFSWSCVVWFVITSFCCIVRTEIQKRLENSRRFCKQDFQWVYTFRLMNRVFIYSIALRSPALRRAFFAVFFLDWIWWNCYIAMDSKEYACFRENKGLGPYYLNLCKKTKWTLIKKLYIFK